MIGQPSAARVALCALSLVAVLFAAGAADAAPLPIGKSKARVAHKSGAVAHHASIRMHQQRLLARGRRIVQIANHMLGTPYRYGGASPAGGFDCSGLVQYVFGRVGLRLPHYTVSQYELGRPVRGRLLPGDLVFFNALGHVGIYAGGGKMIEAPRTGLRVRRIPLAWHGGFAGARRIR
jgi:cell wall-associated NlpC family hydrolase